MLRSGLWLIASQLLLFSVIPFLSRLYEPVDYADYATFLAFFVVASSVCSLRLTDVIVVEVEGYLADLIFSIIIISLSFSFLLTVVYCLLVDNAGSIGWGYLYIALNAQVIIQMASLLDVRNERYGRASMWLALSSITGALLQLLLSDFQDGLVYGHIGGVVLISIFAGLSIVRMLSYRSLTAVTTTVIRNHSFVKYLTLYSLIGGLRSRLIYFLLAGNPLLGVLTQSERLINAPAMLLSGVVRPVIYSSFSESTIKTSGEVIIGGLVSLLFVIATPLVIFTQDYSANIIGFILGGAWVEYHQIFWLVGVATIGVLLTNWMDRLFDITRKQKVSFYTELVMLIFYSVIIYLTSRYLPPKFSIYSYLMLNMVASIVWLSIVYYVCGFGVQNLMKRVGFILFFSVFAVSSYLTIKSSVSSTVYIISYIFIYMVSVFFTFKFLSVTAWLKSKL